MIAELWARLLDTIGPFLLQHGVKIACGISAIILAFLVAVAVTEWQMWRSEKRRRARA